jgi:DNA-binding CsgD family transcriptional regulator
MFEQHNRDPYRMLRAETTELVRDVSHALDQRLDPDPHDPLGDLWDQITAAITSHSPGSDRAELAKFVDLLGRVRALEAQRSRARAGQADRVIGRVQDALRSLETASSVDSLLSLAPQAACRLGFDRALISTVGHVWWPHTMTVVRDPAWAEEIVSVGQEQEPVLDHAIVENDSVHGARATLVQGVQDNPRVNRALATVTKSSSYGIAPLLVDGDVVGLLHGDYYFQDRCLIDEDRSMLSAFASGLSQNLARVTVLDSVAALRSQFDQVGRWTASFSTLAAASQAASHDDGTVLTRREAQIMRLMAAGDTNAKIARRLVISEATVKTHITRILRKLQVSNRAEAVSVWLRTADQTRSAAL